MFSVLQEQSAGRCVFQVFLFDMFVKNPGKLLPGKRDDLAAQLLRCGLPAGWGQKYERPRLLLGRRLGHDKIQIAPKLVAGLGSANLDLDENQKRGLSTSMSIRLSCSPKGQVSTRVQ